MRPALIPESYMNAGLDAGPVQLGAGPGFGGNFATSTTKHGRRIRGGGGSGSGVAAPAAKIMRG